VVDIPHCLTIEITVGTGLQPIGEQTQQKRSGQLRWLSAQKLSPAHPQVLVIESAQLSKLLIDTDLASGVRR
jgi:hypothetical protein